MDHIKILLLDDDEDDFILTRDMLEESRFYNCDLTWEPDPEKAKNLLLEDSFDLALIDYRLGNVKGTELIREVSEQNVVIPMILLTGKGDIRIDLQAMEYGAFDFLTKDTVNSEILDRTIRYAFRHSQALRNLQSNETRYRSLFERSADAVFVTDNEFCIETVSPSFHKLFGTTDEEVRKNSLGLFFSTGLEYETFMEIVQMYPTLKRFEQTFKTHNGDEFHGEISLVRILSAEGDITGYQGIIQDITARKKEENEKLISERLAITGRIARTIAHEVRNPLTNLQLALDQLKDEIGNSEDAHMLSGIIGRNAERIDQLINELLTSSKSQNLEMKKQPIDPVIQEALDLVKDRITLKGMSYTLEIEEDLPRLKIDRNSLKTAVLNILVNAVEAMEEKKGSLFIEVKKINGNVLIRIEDNGKGIPKDELPRLFDPFFTMKKTGTGLGLTSVHTTIRSHEGKIEVESELDEGTSFLIYLPH